MRAYSRFCFEHGQLLISIGYSRDGRGGPNHGRCFGALIARMLQSRVCCICRKNLALETGEHSTEVYRGHVAGVEGAERHD